MGSSILRSRDDVMGTARQGYCAKQLSKVVEVAASIKEEENCFTAKFIPYRSVGPRARNSRISKPMGLEPSLSHFLSPVSATSLAQL